ncbi:hypothetical protein SLE2022_304540 [Rubroshorea leprosula]
MNILRFAGDMTHLISILVLLFRISATQSCSGISMKTQELYLLVFLARLFLPLYYTIVKLVFIASSLAVVSCMREQPALKRSYDKDFDSCRHDFLIAICLFLALLLCERFALQEIFWTFSICLEAVAILPQIVLLQRSGDVDNLNRQYVFSLGAYCAFYILFWIYCYFTEQHFSRWIVGVSAIVQTALYADFFYHYYICWKNKRIKLRQNISDLADALLLGGVLAGGALAVGAVAGAYFCSRRNNALRN